MVGAVSNVVPVPAAVSRETRKGTWTPARPLRTPELILLNHIEWRWSTYGPGWTMRVYPTSWLRLNGTYATGELAWDELYEKYQAR